MTTKVRKKYVNTNKMQWQRCVKELSTICKMQKEWATSKADDCYCNSNFIRWDALEQAIRIVKRYGNL